MYANYPRRDDLWNDLNGYILSPPMNHSFCVFLNNLLCNIISSHSIVWEP